MTPVNPHWDVTDTPKRAGSAVAKTASPTLNLPVAIPRGSPRPAAMLGVLFVVGTGLFLSVQNTPLSGSVTSKTINLTSSGFSQTTINVNQGDTLALRNGDNVTHTVQIINPISGRDPLVSITLMARRAGVMTILESIPTGTYTLSTADPIPAIAQLNVGAGDGSVDTSVPVPSTFGSTNTDSPSTGTNGTQNVGGQPVIDLGNGSASSRTIPSVTNPVDAPLPFGGGAENAIDTFPIEVNPYALGNGPLHPSAAATTVTQTALPTSVSQLAGVSATETRSYPNTSATSALGALPRQPSSGAELWVAIAAALVGFWFFVRRMTVAN